MSMTLEEAIKNREEFLQYLEGIGQKAIPDCVEAVRWSVKALKALRPVSREQVRRGEWEKIGADYRGQGGIWRCTECRKTYPYKCDFCPNCGTPMTDEAVQMVMERLEELHENIHND